MRRSIGERTKTWHALFFGGPTPFLLALSKEMGSGKIRFKGRQPFAFGYFLQEQKVPRRQAKPDSSARAFLTLRLFATPGFRPRKVRLAPFSPNGENCARCLARPLPVKPALLGFHGVGEVPPSLWSIRAAHDGLALGKETVSDRQRKARYHGLLPTIQRPTLWQLGYSLPPVPLPRVVATSAPLHFRPTAKITFASLLLLSPPNPLRWASAGTP